MGSILKVLEKEVISVYAQDLKKIVKENTNFRTVLVTGVHSQLVAMNIAIGEDIGEEVHQDVDQIIYIFDGECEAIINGESQMMEEHDVVFVPAGAVHNFKNVGDEALKLFTVYSPPEHADGTIHATKADAQKGEITS